MNVKKNLNFSQRSGLSPLPTQLKLGQLSKEVRSLIWNEIHSTVISSRRNVDYATSLLGRDWEQILRSFFVRELHKPVHQFSNILDIHIQELSDLIFTGQFNVVFDFVEFVLQHPLCPPSLPSGINQALSDGRAAYRVVNTNTIMPIGTEAEAEAIQKAIWDAKSAKLDGVVSHLISSATSLRHGKWADSVRESISAVESIAVHLASEKKTLGAALSVLEKSGHLHGALKGAFSSLYGFTSDEEGIRHALVLENKANVDEADAMFMFGACASFVSYLITKGREIGSIKF